MTKKQIKKRLEHLRRTIRSESISYGDIIELQYLSPHIEDDDVELLEAAGIKEI